MKIILSSENKSKINSLQKGLETLGIENIEIISVKVDSEVSQRPINEEIVEGCLNRNENALKYALSNNIEYDYLCSIEGGFEDSNDYPYVVTYTVFEDRNGNKSTGKSLGIRITKNMMKYLREGNSLNKLIEQIINEQDYKTKGGITAYLSNNVLNREKVDCDAVIAAFVPIILKKERQALDLKIKEELKWK